MRSCLNAIVVTCATRNAEHCFAADDVRLMSGS
jgi:hypothetical protein